MRLVRARTGNRAPAKATSMVKGMAMSTVRTKIRLGVFLSTILVNVRPGAMVFVNLL